MSVHDDLAREQQLAAAYRGLYFQQRDILDNLAQALIDWHGTISRAQFLDAFDGLPEDLIPDVLTATEEPRA